MSKIKEILRGVVHPWHCDSFGHMNVRWYAHFFDDGAYHVWSVFWGSHQRMAQEFGLHTVTGRAATVFRKELVAGDLIVIDCAVTRIGGKSCTFVERMRHADSGFVHATYELTEVFFDPRTRKAAPMPDSVRAAVEPMLVTAGELDD